MKKLYFVLLTTLLLTVLKSNAINVTIINSIDYPALALKWQTICQAMGNSATITPETELDSLSNLSATDILIVSSGVDAILTAARINVIEQYLQNGGKVYLQSEYLATFIPNMAFATIVNSFGGNFSWTGVVSGFLNPMNVLGTIAVDNTTTGPIPNFWYGQSMDSCADVEMFLEYNGQYFGCVYCIPTSTGRIITTTDQDWIFNFSPGWQTDSLMMNIITNLSKTSYNCAAPICGSVTPPPVADFESSDSTICANDCINFTDLSTNATSWQWLFSGALDSTSAAQNPQYICYSKAGTFNVKEVVYNSGGRDSVAFSNFIIVHPSPPIPVITQLHDTLYCSTNASYLSYQWYSDSAIINGATDTLLVISIGGGYNVKVTNTYSCSISAGINININAGINELSATGNISLSPNPATDRLTIHFSSVSNLQAAMVSVMNVLGQNALPPLSLQKRGEDATIDVSGLSTGIYFLQLKTESGLVMKKFIKN